jgi:hypothetical protein
VHGGPAVIDAVRACWASLWTARAIAYRARQGISPTDVALAVVVQRMVLADVAGVMFTADPITGARDRIVVNAVRGLGEELIAGTADPQVIVLDRDGDAILDRHGERWLDDATARDLAAVGRRIERLFVRTVDVEWAVYRGEIAVLQARPITVTGHEEWNDSMAGDYLWTCANLGEAMSVPALGPHPVCGRIGGRFYLNLSVAMGAGSALGLGGRVRRTGEQAIGGIPAQMEIPGCRCRASGCWPNWCRPNWCRPYTGDRVRVDGERGTAQVLSPVLSPRGPACATHGDGPTASAVDPSR